MKKICLFLSFIFLFIAACSGDKTQAAEEYPQYDGVNISEILQEFLTKHPNRNAGTDAERDAAYFLAEQFLKNDLLGKSTDYDYEFLKNEFDEGVLEDLYFQNFEYTLENETFFSQNVVATKKSSKENAKNVIIGAHYDNVFNLVDGDFSGASDNGSGVATMLAIMQNVSKLEFDFDLTFVAFGAEEIGLVGSQSYVEKLSRVERQDILLVFNLDVVAAGKKIFLYCDETERDYEKFLLANKGGSSVSSLPKNKKILLDSMGKYPYRHTGFFSDNFAFMLANIKTAFFYAGDYDGFIFSEKAGEPYFMHSSKDYFESLAENFPQYESFMQQVALSVQNALCNPEFESVMLSDKGGNYDLLIDSNFNLLLMLLVLAGFVAFYVYMLKKQPPIQPQAQFIPEKRQSIFGDEYEN